MKINIQYSEIQDDLLKLYCQTKHSSIEDIFLKFSQDYQHNISRWIQLNKGVKQHLRNPSVYSALEALDFLNKKIGDEPSLSNIIKNITPYPKYLSTLPIIVAFRDIMYGKVKNILYPFRNIIDTMAKQIKIPEGDVPEDAAVIQDDLLMIQNLFEKNINEYITKPVKVPRQALTQQRIAMFSTLLKKFSEEMAVASDTQGFTELAKAFRTGVLAIPAPFGIGKYIELDLISEDQMTESKKMAEYVIQYPGAEFANYHHDLIEIDLLQKAGGLTKEDAYRFKEAYESEKNVMEYLDDKEKMHIADVPGINTEEMITSDTRMNPDYIYMLAMFFFFMQKKLRIPPISLGLV